MASNRASSLKLRHVGQVERACPGSFPRAHDQHAGRYIQAAHLVCAGQHRGDGTGSAGDVQQGRGARLMALLEEAADNAASLTRIAGHDVIVRGQQIVG